MKITVNGEAIDTQCTELSALLDELEVKRDGMAVEINEVIIPRGQIDKTAISEGDEIEIVSLVGGG